MIVQINCSHPSDLVSCFVRKNETILTCIESCIDERTIKDMKTALFSLLLLSLFFTSCGSKVPNNAVYVNPYPQGTHKNFLARLDYLQTHDIYKDVIEYEKADPKKTYIEINLSSLRGQLFNKDGLVILDYPIAGGTEEFPTPTGKFRIWEKKEDKESNIYGVLYDKEGNVIKKDADVRVDEVTEEMVFDGADMPYWMRLTGDGIGMHQGNVPRRPASHGCIRHTMEGVKQVFAKVEVGTKVTIK